MIIETVIFPSGRTAVQLRPEEGFKYVTDGSIWSDCVTLGVHDMPDRWHDTNDEPPEEEEPA